MKDNKGGNNMEEVIFIANKDIIFIPNIDPDELFIIGIKIKNNKGYICGPSNPECMFNTYGIYENGIYYIDFDCMYLGHKVTFDSDKVITGTFKVRKEDDD